MLSWEERASNCHSCPQKGAVDEETTPGLAGQAPKRQDAKTAFLETDDFAQHSRMRVFNFGEAQGVLVFLRLSVFLGMDPSVE